MSENSHSFSRRDMLKASGALAAGALASNLVIPTVHAAGSDEIQVALIGAGSRGSGAAMNALHTEGQGPIKLVAIADVFEDKLSGSYNALSKDKGIGKRVDVPQDRKFVSFDGYKQAMDCLKPGDIAILATPLAFRPAMYEYAIAKGLHVFMEKPLTADGVSSKKMLELAKQSSAKNLKSAVGLMCRHDHEARGILREKIAAGELGDIVAMRCYRVTGPTGSAFTGPRDANNDKSELLWQIRRFHAFLWASGGAFSDFLIHNIDECCWMKGGGSKDDDIRYGWPVEAKGGGGRHYREGAVDQNFDTYSAEFTFEDGSKLFCEGRGMTGIQQEFASYCHGSKGSAIISTSSHSPAKSRIFKGQRIGDKNAQVWAAGPEHAPYEVEWDSFIKAIRGDKPYNEVPRGVMASLVTSMGRMACHTGQIITLDQMLDSTHEFSPGADSFTMDSPAPVQADENGKYPVPEPGRKKTEY